MQRQIKGQMEERLYTSGVGISSSQYWTAFADRSISQAPLENVKINPEK